jgi:hypothetical protein
MAVLSVTSWATLSSQNAAAVDGDTLRFDGTGALTFTATANLTISKSLTFALGTGVTSVTFLMKGYAFTLSGNGTLTDIIWAGHDFDLYVFDQEGNDQNDLIVNYEVDVIPPDHLALNNEIGSYLFKERHFFSDQI